MRGSLGRLLLVALLFAFGAASPAACGGTARPPTPKPAEKPGRWFEYDPAATPLDIQTARVDRRGDVVLQDLTYASPRGGRVPAYLVLPPASAKAPFPAVIFVHWGTGDRAELLPDALALARLGAASLLLDAPFARPAPWYRPLGGAEDRIVYAQTVVDVRRGMDLLATRPDIDPKRIALVGHGFGAQVVGIVSGVDPRPHTFVVMAGVPSLSTLLRDLHTPEMDRVRESTPREVLDAYLRELAPLDASHFVGAAGEGAWLFQYGTFDPLATPRLGEEYAALVKKGTTEVKTYDAAQTLNDPAAFSDRIGWLAKRLLGARARSQAENTP